MVVLIPLEIASRELLFKVYLSHMLTLNGFTCYLGRKKSIWFLAKKMKGYVYIDKGYHAEHSELIYDIVRSRSGFIVSLDEEGAVDFSSNETLMKRYSKALFKKIDHVFFWGRSQFDIVKDNIQNNLNYSITGHPRFELLKPKYSKLYEVEAKSISERYGDFILINTNMGFGNNISGDDFIRDKSKGYGKWFANIDEIIEQDKMKLEAYIKLVKILCSKFDKYIIFRPHPEENLDIYKEAFTDYEKVIVENHSSVIPWLIAAGIMIHPDCTTSIESFIIDKKSISYMPSNASEDITTSLPINLSHSVRDLDTLISIIKNNKNVDITENDNFLIEEYFSIKSDSSNLIAKKISEFSLKEPVEKYYKLFFLDLLSLKFNSLKFRFSANKSIELAKKKIEELTQRNISRQHQAIINLNKDFSKVCPEKITNELYRFSIKNGK